MLTRYNAAFVRRFRTAALSIAAPSAASRCHRVQRHAATESRGTRLSLLSALMMVTYLMNYIPSKTESHSIVPYCHASHRYVPIVSNLYGYLFDDTIYTLKNHSLTLGTRDNTGQYARASVTLDPIRPRVAGANPRNQRLLAT